MNDYMEARSRPLGISILAVLALIGGVGMTIVLAVAAYALANNPTKLQEASEAMAAMGLPVPLLVIGVVFLAILATASGVGMWQGKKWGWYLGSFWYAYAIVRNTSALIMIGEITQAMPSGALEGSGRGPEFYYFKYAGRLVVSLLIYAYFFKANVREYFGLTDVSRWKAVATEFAICLCIVVGTSLIVLAMS